MKNRKTLWAISANQFGLYQAEPLEVTYDPNLDSYWDSEGEFDVPGEGYHCLRGTVHQFASTDRDEVVQFIEDYKSAVGFVADALHGLSLDSPGAAAVRGAVTTLAWAWSPE